MCFAIHQPTFPSEQCGFLNHGCCGSPSKWGALENGDWKKCDHNYLLGLVRQVRGKGAGGSTKKGLLESGTNVIKATCWRY
jgi:hypothetical protein